MRKLLVIVMACVAVGAGRSAMAAPVTWTFTGTVIAGFPHAGQSVAGSLTVDPDALTKVFTDGSTFNAQEQSYYPPLPSPLEVSGSATVGTLNVSVGGGPDWDWVHVEVQKNAYGYRDAYIVTATSSSNAGILLWTEKITDGVHPSNMFTNTDYNNPDLSIVQSVNWFSAGAGSYGHIRDEAGVTSAFLLTSMTVSSAPEPATFVLLGIGLAGLAASRRRKH